MRLGKITVLSGLVALTVAAQDKNAATPQAPARQTLPEQPAGTAPGTARTAGERTAQGLKNAFTQYRMEDLPAAVQKTVREQAGGQPIADIDREDRNGQTIWEVEFEREGRNPTIHVGNDGTLMPEKQTGALGTSGT